jgi:hypothetical protein
MPTSHSRWVGSTIPAAGGGAGGTGAVAHGSLLTVDNVGPWTLQGVAKGSEALDSPAMPTRGYWRTDTPDEFVPAGTYVYNNSPTNHGGTVPAGGLTIDGYAIPAGTLVSQFRNFGAGTFGCTGTTPVLFRGCRFRGPNTAPGVLNDAGNGAPLYVLYCDAGGLGAADAQYNEVPFKIAGSPNSILARNFITYTTTGIQVNSHQCRVVENYIDKLTYFYGPNPPPGEGTDKHLNGFTMNGGENSILFLRNHVTLPSPDDAGRTINQTDAFSMFQDFGAFPGTGTNADGTTGYRVVNNYLGGGGVTVYAGVNAGQPQSSVANMYLVGNRVTTQWWPNGGAVGAITAVPAWGSNGNSQSDNLWDDGANAGTSFV